MAPKFYDPSSENEQAPPLPSAPLRTLAPNVVLQPPLTRRGSGPGIILFLPDPSKLSPRTATKPLDPEPVQKWAEEGFAVVGVTVSNLNFTADSINSVVRQSLDGLLALDQSQLDKRDKFAIIVYDASPELYQILSNVEGLPITCLIVYGISANPDTIRSAPRIPTLLQLTQEPNSEPPKGLTIHHYSDQTNHFVFPQSSDYHGGSAALSHSRSLVFLRKWLGGPFFDLEAIWAEHCYFEFEVRSVAKTMATMVQEPYVNHVPTMTGGVGRAALTAFYRDHFIFCNPEDTRLEVISRTVGADRIVEELIVHYTHNKMIDYLLPGVPPTGKKLAVPLVAVVNIRGDRLYNEHIWWDQATTLRQAGLLPDSIPFNDGSNLTSLRLPVAGVECAEMLSDEQNGKSNEMMGSAWGVRN
ncbi:hypothetical protein AGABI2DRAFT_194603 [Agaricus bisporus var. bisporus H97]|uniref:hypothetical protein n=1 Tax=Agaricus bisporus var. bisporus (strain H97 / ATCC MYA-4626 / FGSC 10389) TaxID=936046 RepID=UPI00029F5996|nr:hypothetical protein AGABI2DRAFT_194603 [Agaricus bisporus var. bisporus H97]EKV44655.1 hypothetical protein AGABI2DRAFT_194603 [Agaricus bisporus var. bisporus H97]